MKISKESPNYQGKRIPAEFDHSHQEVNAEIVNVIKEYVGEEYKDKVMDDTPKSEITLTVSDKTFLDFLLMKIRAKTIAYATMKKKKRKEKKKKTD